MRYEINPYAIAGLIGIVTAGIGVLRSDTDMTLLGSQATILTLALEAGILDSRRYSNKNLEIQSREQNGRLRTSIFNKSSP